MDERLWDSIVVALRELWPARGDRHPDSKDVLDKMIEQGAGRPAPNALIEELQELRGRGLIQLSRGTLDPEGAKEHGAVVITFVHPALLI
jgi:hypothetical protein